VSVRKEPGILRHATDGSPIAALLLSFAVIG
jgi:hypothetical protein